MAIELSITDEQLLVIDQGLQELPFRVAAPVIAAINEQLRAIRLAGLDYHPGQPHGAPNVETAPAVAT